jgi:Homeodomain-like domain-containing protein
MADPEAAWERTMTVQEVTLKALSGEMHWYRAADILGFSARTLRRWRERYEKHGLRRSGRQTTAYTVGATDRSAGGRAATAAVPRPVPWFNVRHFCRFSVGRDPSFSKPFPPELFSRLRAL